MDNRLMIPARGRWIAAALVLIATGPAAAADVEYDAGTFVPTGAFKFDRHHNEGGLALKLSFLSLSYVRRKQGFNGFASDGAVDLSYASSAYTVSSDDAATDDAAPHASDVVMLNGHLHGSVGKWYRSIGEKHRHHGIGAQLAGALSPIDQSFSASIGYTYLMVGKRTDGDVIGLDPTAFHLHLHAGIGVGYWNVPHVHQRAIPCDTAEDPFCEPTFVEEPHTTDLVAMQFPTISFEVQSGESPGWRGAVELRGPGPERSVVEFRASGGVAPPMSEDGKWHLGITAALEITRSFGDVHEYPEHGLDGHITLGPEYTF